ncbi:hypothetical protein E2P81_ATG09970 [Venturia nashicola]|uniref:Uncharacterized protein n=1 Tax=Venturia nashicola TaxID=86259 RepID=A0A4Z1NKV1_9PEZI|nr:hypothetical protein E6O75_ATG10191 [Venturia nashicola]TLD18672.1 hypothetical protein E2P81_ATG09970 [Venturia nashicola]
MRLSNPLAIFILFDSAFAVSPALLRTISPRDESSVGQTGATDTAEKTCILGKCFGSSQTPSTSGRCSVSQCFAQAGTTVVQCHSTQFNSKATVWTSWYCAVGILKMGLDMRLLGVFEWSFSHAQEEAVQQIAGYRFQNPSRRVVELVFPKNVQKTDTERDFSKSQDETTRPAHPSPYYGTRLTSSCLRVSHLNCRDGHASPVYFPDNVQALGLLMLSLLSLGIPSLAVSPRWARQVSCLVVDSSRYCTRSRLPAPEPWPFYALEV